MSGAYALFDDPAAIERFRAFLLDSGCMLLDEISPVPGELLRFAVHGRKNLVARSKKRGISVRGPDVATAAAAFVAGRAWRPFGGASRHAGKGLDGLRAELRLRDGPDCFYCGRPLGDDVTIEELLARAWNGPRRAENCALAHARCNELAGSLPVVHKVRLRDRLHRLGRPA